VSVSTFGVACEGVRQCEIRQQLHKLPLSRLPTTGSQQIFAGFDGRLPVAGEEVTLHAIPKESDKYRQAWLLRYRSCSRGVHLGRPGSVAPMQIDQPKRALCGSKLNPSRGFGGMRDPILVHQGSAEVPPRFPKLGIVLLDQRQTVMEVPKVQVLLRHPLGQPQPPQASGACFSHLRGVMKGNTPLVEPAHL
jgi:hypothetical protein